MKPKSFFGELTRIFTRLAKFVRRTATSREIAGLAQPLQPILPIDQTIIVECFGIRGSSFASKGLLGFRPSGYEISGLKAAQRLQGRSSLRGGVVAFDSAASILLPTFETPPWVMKALTQK